MAEENPVVEQAPEAQRAEAEAAFAETFDEPKVEAKVDTPAATEKTPEKPAAVEKPAAPDPWEGVPAVVKEKLTALDALPAQLTDIKRSFGGLHGFVKKALDDAKKGGAETPSEKQIAAATETPEKWKKFQEDWPEVAEALESRLAGQTGQPQVKIDEIIKAEMDKMAKEFGEARKADRLERAEFEKRTRLIAKHGDWIGTINTPEFQDWLHDGIPATEVARERELRLAAKEEFGAQRPADGNLLLRKANELWSSWQTKYPEWWKDRGSLSDSDKVEDASKLLDAFAAKQQPDAAEGRAASRGEDKSRRLLGAVPARGTTQPRQPQLNDRDSQQKGFNDAFAD